MDPKNFPNLRTRREFIRQAACAAVGTISMSATIRDLRFINAAVAQSALTDYKALVCIFLAGGNDSNNMIVPIDTDGYTLYSGTRGLLSIPQPSLLPLNALNNDGHSYGIHPAMPGVATLFGESKCGLVFNAGPLVYPLTATQYKNGSVATPPQLFSHSDQQTHWQTSLPDQPPKTGWGGRIADLMHPLQLDLVNGIPGANAAKIALCTSLAGTNTLEVGNVFGQYSVSTGGAITLGGVSGNRLQAVRDLIALPDSNLQRKAYAGVVKNALDVGATLNAAISLTASPSYWTTPFPANSYLASQLQMIARLIAARSTMNMKRQVFFASVGGYDTHTSQIGTNGNTDATIGAHANLLGELSKGIYAFQRAMEQLGVGNNVTAFTASDFGRTFKTNSVYNVAGSDHGWGSHHLVIGGAVNGKRTYGAFPILDTKGPDSVPTSNEGRWIPKISVDEYSATLAKWFGVSSGNMPVIFPNLGRFNSPDVGFML